MGLISSKGLRPMQDQTKVTLSMKTGNLIIHSITPAALPQWQLECHQDPFLLLLPDWACHRRRPRTSLQASLLLPRPSDPAHKDMR